MMRSLLRCFRPALLLVAAAPAQEPVRSITDDYLIQRWETEHGLPENSATAFAQTADGYLWFGTFNGLVRFDGVEFTVFGPAEIPVMKHPAVFNLFRDARQRLWVSTGDGLLVREGETWRRLGPQEGWTGDYARSFAGRPNGDVLITDFKGLIFESAGNGVRALPPPEAMEKGQGGIAGVDDEGLWWVVQNRFIGRREGDRWVEKFPSRADLGRGAVGCGPARGGGLWLKQGRELLRIHGGAVAERRQLQSDTGGFWSMMEDSRGHVWVASHHMGTSRIAPDGALSRWDEPGGGGDHGRCVFEDREGNLWFGTSGDGLARATPRRFHTVKLGGTRRGIQVTSVAPRAAGGFWLATNGHGLTQLPADGTVSRVELPDSEKKAAYLVSVLEDRRGAVWLGTAGNGLWRWANGTLEAFSPESAGGSTPRVLFEDGKGRLWSGGGDGLAVYENGKWRPADAGGRLDGVAVTALAEDTGGSVWVAHAGGVLRSDARGNFLLLKEAGADFRDITALCAGAGGAVWLGSASRGLWRWLAGRLDRVPGFPADRVDSLIADGQGNLWAPAGYRLVRAPLSGLHAVTDKRAGRLRAQVFEAADGLDAKQFGAGEQPVAARDAAGRLCFAAAAGAVMCDPAALPLNPLPPPVQAVRLHWRREGRNPDDPAGAEQSRGPFTAPVILPPGSRYIEMHYAALSLTAPEKNRYEVRLDGVDRDWRAAGTVRRAFYHELPPGDYVFRVRGSNNDGAWNETGAALSFTVQPFYWQTAWFRLQAVTLAAGLISGVLVTSRRARRRRRAERRASERELQVAREELAHLTRVAMLGELSGSLAHELNQPLAAVLSNAQAGMRFITGGQPDLEEMQAILQDIADDAKRAGGIIHGMRAMFKKDTRQELQPVEVNEVVQQVLALLHSEIVARQAEVAFTSGAALPRVLAGKVELMQVLLNLVLNGLDAMKELSGPRLVWIDTSLEAGRIALRVRDSGAGIAPEVREKLFTPFVSTKSGGLGMGLAISRGIVERFGGRLTARNHPHGGAEFCLLLPPEKAPLQPETDLTD